MAESPIPDAKLDLSAARTSLADEWRQSSPDSPECVKSFYENAIGIPDDLDAWHIDPSRTDWTETIVFVAKKLEADLQRIPSIIDLGCGVGTDLIALRDAGFSEVCGVEINKACHSRLDAAEVPYFTSPRHASVEDADLLICIDVLEHLPEPEAWLASWARRAKVGATLIEATAVYDVDTPLHLPENRGWDPGHILESLGFETREGDGRLRIWRRLDTEAPKDRATLAVCSYRNISVPTAQAITLLTSLPGWRPMFKHGDGLISRSRSLVASKWLRETADDVLLMVDDDITFLPQDADRLAEWCRNGKDVVCAAYPVRDGKHLALQLLDGPGEITFGPNLEPIPLAYGSTGFMAFHRRVFEALAERLPLCHANTPWSFWPFFLPSITEPDASGCRAYLSEDWAACLRARNLGFGVWLDPTICVGHLATVPISVRNMGAVAQALG